MKKETTVIATVEITNVMKNFSFENKTLEETKQDIKNSLTNHIKKDDWFNADNVNVCDVKIFELEKEERISTKDLIKSARYCIEEGYCSECPINEECIQGLYLTKALTDRLEEMHNQQTATPTEQPKITRREYVLNNAEKFPLLKEENIDKYTINAYCPSDFGLEDGCNNHNSCDDCWNCLVEV